MQRLKHLQSPPECNLNYRRIVDEGHGDTCVICVAKHGTTENILPYYGMDHMKDHRANLAQVEQMQGMPESASLQYFAPNPVGAPPPRDSRTAERERELGFNNRHHVTLSSIRDGRFRRLCKTPTFVESFENPLEFGWYGELKRRMPPGVTIDRDSYSMQRYACQGNNYSWCL